jgi:hypothetical protein
MNTRDLFFEDLAAQIDRWADAATKGLTQADYDAGWAEAPDDFRKMREVLSQANVSPQVIRSVMRSTLRGGAHSFLLILDRATKLAEDALVFLVDEDGEIVEEALHEYFAEYLMHRDRAEKEQ